MAGNELKSKKMKNNSSNSEAVSKEIVPKPLETLKYRAAVKQKIVCKQQIINNHLKLGFNGELFLTKFLTAINNIIAKKISNNQPINKYIKITRNNDEV